MKKRNRISCREQIFCFSEENSIPFHTAWTLTTFELNFKRPLPRWEDSLKNWQGNHYIVTINKSRKIHHFRHILRALTYGFSFLKPRWPCCPSALNMSCLNQWADIGQQPEVQITEITWSQSPRTNPFSAAAHVFQGLIRSIRWSCLGNRF